MTLYGPLESDARVLRSVYAFKAINKKVTIITCNTRKGFETEGVNIIDLPLKVGRMGYVKFCLKTLIYYLRHASRFDMIYLQDFFSTVPGLLIHPFARKKRMIYDAHELIIPMEGQKLTSKTKLFVNAERKLSKKVECIIEANKERAEIFKQRYGLDNVTFVHNISKLSFCGVKRTLPPNGSVIMVYQGVISKGRNLSFFVKCLKELPASYRLMFIGNGEGLDDLKKTARNLDIENRIVFTGRLSNDEMVERLKDCHIGIISYPFTSLNNIYCSPNKIFEYSALALPFIASEQPFFKEVQGQYKIGRTFKFNDVRSFVEETKKLVESYEESACGFEQFLRDYSFSKEMDKLRNILKNGYTH